MNTYFRLNFCLHLDDGYMTYWIILMYSKHILLRIHEEEGMSIQFSMSFPNLNLPMLPSAKHRRLHFNCCLLMVTWSVLPTGQLNYNEYKEHFQGSTHFPPQILNFAKQIFVCTVSDEHNLEICQWSFAQHNCNRIVFTEVYKIFVLHFRFSVEALCFKLPYCQLWTESLKTVGTWHLTTRLASMG
jgi:hypothetical protein